VGDIKLWDKLRMTRVVGWEKISTGGQSGAEIWITPPTEILRFTQDDSYALSDSLFSGDY